MEGFEVGAGAGVGVAALVGGLVGKADVSQEGVGVFAELGGVYRTTEAAEGGDVVQEVAADGVCFCGGGKAGAVLGDEPGDAFPVLEDVLGVFVWHGCRCVWWWFRRGYCRTCRSCQRQRAGEPARRAVPARGWWRVRQRGAAGRW